MSNLTRFMNNVERLDMYDGIYCERILLAGTDDEDFEVELRVKNKHEYQILRMVWQGTQDAPDIQDFVAMLRLMYDFTIDADTTGADEECTDAAGGTEPAPKLHGPVQKTWDDKIIYLPVGPTMSKDPRFPHKCEMCGGDAYQGATAFEHRFETKCTKGIRSLY